MHIILFDTYDRDHLFPFTATRAVSAIRAGILTGAERWRKLTGLNVFSITASYLQPAYEKPENGPAILVNAALIPDKNIFTRIMELGVNEAIVHDGKVIAAASAESEHWDIDTVVPGKFKKCIFYKQPLKSIERPWHIFQLNDELIRYDFALLTRGRKSKRISRIDGWTATENIFIEDGVAAPHCYINASEGPVYLAKNSDVMEGCMIRGPFALGEGSVLKMGAKIYGATTVGPYCTAGGEIKNTVMMGYSNKAHEGYLGDSVIGEWCNLGAGTVNSNIRNDASIVYANKGMPDGLPVALKCGLLMGDYTRTAINTSLNTGTFAGVAGNIFGPGLAPKQLPNFTWGFSERYIFDKAIEHIANWKRLKQHHLSPAEIGILEHLYKQNV
ncbi:MAG TPA: putative sugar nucleotidyl transferase [Agriterribacter sp.]|nr:putative sugar nucleotidyl transferase [Agriterribacter sp.]